MSTPGSLKITESETIEVSADSAKLHITISGDNFIYGNAAVEKCKEVKAFVDRAKAAGIPDDAIKIKSVSVKISSGLLSRTSSAVYSLAISVADLSKLGELLGIVSDSKTISLDMLEWKYNEDEARRSAAERALLKAKKKADAMMAAIDYRVAGINSCADRYEAPRAAENIRFAHELPAMSRVRASAASADFGTEFKSSKEITAEVSVDFSIVPKDA